MLLSVVSMLCKEQGVTVLGVCVVYDLLLISVVEVRDVAESIRIIGKWIWCILTRSAER